MATAFVSGGTGFLGRNLLERLLAGGWRVHALHRHAEPPPEWEGSAILPVRGDLLDVASLVDAMPEAVDAVFHLAADTSPWRGHRARQWAVNVGGTEAILQAALRRRAARFVHVSSASVWGRHEGVVSETTPQRGRASRIGYVRSKAVAEERVRAAAAQDLDAVILNPTHIMGRFDRHNWARLFLLTARDALPGVPPGGGCFANAGDVADAAIVAASRGRRGENYILGGPHASFLEVIGRVAHLLDKPSPRRAAPAFLIRAAGLAGDLRGLLTGCEPDITLAAAALVCHDEHVCSGKAAAELAYRQTPLAESLAQCHAWLVECGLLAGPS